MWWITIRYILKTNSKREWICIFPSHDFRSFLPCQLYNSSNLSRPPVHFWPNKKSLGFSTQKLRRSIRAPEKPFQVGGSTSNSSRSSPPLRSSSYFLLLGGLVSMGPEGHGCFFRPGWSFVKLKDLGKGTPSKWPKNPRKMNEWGWVGGLLARRLPQL